MTKLLKPFLVTGKVVKGFGRGSKQLGIPTANIDTSVVQSIELENAIYYGFCQLLDQKTNKTNGNNNENNQNGCTPSVNGSDGRLTGDNLSKSDASAVRPAIYGMVCSLGWNPHFNNTIRSLEVHILNQFVADFYGSTLRVAICGYIRSEQKFDSLAQLIRTIHNDIDVAKQELKDLHLWSHVIDNEFFDQK